MATEVASIHKQYTTQLILPIMSISSYFVKTLHYNFNHSLVDSIKAMHWTISTKTQQPSHTRRFVTKAFIRHHLSKEFKTSSLPQLTPLKIPPQTHNLQVDFPALHQTPAPVSMTTKSPRDIGGPTINKQTHLPRHQVMRINIIFSRCFYPRCCHRPLYKLRQGKTDDQGGGWGRVDQILNPWLPVKGIVGKLV